MKKIAIALCLLLPLWCAAQDYDFAKKIGDNTLYFSILTTGGKEWGHSGSGFSGN